MLTTRPFAHLPELDDAEKNSAVNVTNTERLASAMAGIGLVAGAVRAMNIKGLVSAVAGVLLINRAVRGHCKLYKALSGPDSHTGTRGEKGVKVEKELWVNAPRMEVFRYWRKLENLPRIMPHLESVTETDDKISHWVVTGPGGKQMEWDAEIINETPGRLLAWQSLPGAEIENAGTVRFDASKGGTKIRVVLQYHPPGGSISGYIAKMLGVSPAQLMEEDLQRFKQEVESGASN